MIEKLEFEKRLRQYLAGFPADYTVDTRGLTDLLSKSNHFDGMTVADLTKAIFAYNLHKTIPVKYRAAETRKRFGRQMTVRAPLWGRRPYEEPTVPPTLSQRVTSLEENVARLVARVNYLERVDDELR